MMGEPERGTAAWWEDRYRSGDIPWDTGVVPPEVVSLVSSGLLMPGWALDLGCGSGIAAAISHAHLSGGRRRPGSQRAARGRRSAATDSPPRTSAVATSVICASWPCRRPLPWTSAVSTPSPPSGRPSYVASLAAHLLPGAYYLLYAFEPTPGVTDAPPGIGPRELPFLSRISSSAGRVTAWIVTDLLPGTCCSGLTPWNVTPLTYQPPVGCYNSRAKQQKCPPEEPCGLKIP